MFDRYGGFARVSKVVSGFYDKALDSDVLGPYFENTDMRTLIDHQTKFVASIMGGPASYSDAELTRIHARLNIGDNEFSEMVELFVETLEDFHFEDADIAVAREQLVMRKSCIVTGGR